MKNKCFLVFLFCLSISHVYSQETLYIYVNQTLWNGKSTKSISPDDTIKIFFKGLSNKLYQFKNLGVEVILRRNIGTNKEQRRKRRIVVQESQFHRIISGPMIDKPSTYHIDTRFSEGPSQNLSLIIPCSLFTKYTPFSRFILHIEGIFRIENGTSILLNNSTLRYEKKDFRDGFSFWRGPGFN